MPGRCYFFSAFNRALAFCTVAIFSGRFIRFHVRISSFDRPQLTQRSPFNWQSEIQGLSIGEAIVELPVGRDFEASVRAATTARIHTSGLMDFDGQVPYFMNRKQSFTNA